MNTKKADDLQAVLLVEREHGPLSLNTGRPEFSWHLSAQRRGCMQKRRRLTVAEEHGGLLWDSGWCEDAAMTAPYGGPEIPPETACTVTLDVEDDAGNRAQAAERFRTGLMAQSFSDPAWAGARWIGTDTLNLRADALSVFRLSAEITLVPGSCRAGIVLGADDPRLLDRNRNILHMQARPGESRIVLCLYLPDPAAGEQAALEIYRSGYVPEDRPDVPLTVLPLPAELCSLDRSAPHTLSAELIYGEADLFLDGVKLNVAAEPGPFGGAAKINLNPAGRGGDFICYPNLCHVGALVPAGQTAVFHNLAVRNYRTPCSLLFSMFEQPERLQAGEQELTVVQDPSHGGLPMLRCEFTAGSVRRAWLAVTARGVYEAYINGGKVGSDWFAPGLTQYNRTHMYQVYDVTAQIHPGENVLGFLLGEGWWSGAISFTGSNQNFWGDRQCVLAKLTIEDESGQIRTLVTDPGTFTASDGGPHRSASLFQGHVYDARLYRAVQGWTEPGFTGSWAPAAEIPIDSRSCTIGVLSAGDPMGWQQDMTYDSQRCMGQIGGGVKLVCTLPAQSVTEVRPGLFLCDFGQNIAGTVSVRIPAGTAGRKITLRYAEILYPMLEEYGEYQGMLMTENLRGAYVTDEVITGTQAFTYMPQFTFHGFRWLEISGLDSAPDPADVQALALSSAAELTADFRCSDEKINRLFRNICWSLQDNFLSIPTDCPQRNERMGWSGDLSVFSRTAVYLCDADAFLRRHMTALRDMQRADGMFPDIAPVTNGFGGILWGSVGMTAPWECYQQYGDTAILADNYDAMVRYIRYLAANVDDRGLQTAGNLGDWLGPQLKRTENKLLWTAYYIYDLEIMAMTAELLEKPEAAEFRQMWAQARHSFNAVYFDPVSHRTVYSDQDAARGNRMPFEPVDASAPLPPQEPGGGYRMDTQTSCCVPLALNAVEPEHREALLAHLNRVCSTPDRDDSGVLRPAYSLMTGFIGTAWVLPALSEGGYDETAWRMLQNTAYPSWLYPVEQGATTIWERLDSYTEERGFGGNNSMNSFNHYSFGAVGQWMLSRALGIRRDVPGFRRFTLAPAPDPAGGVTFAAGYCDTVSGRIESAWEQSQAGITYRLTVPAGTDCTLQLQLQPGSTVLESGLPAEQAPGVTFLDRTESLARYHLLSGSYTFCVSAARTDV